MARRIEEPLYDVLETYDDFELRRYGTAIQARVQTAGRDSGGASGGFRRVAGYIFGGNDAGASIAMTAPVSMWDEEGTGWLAFTMPAAYALDALPAPNDSGVLLTSKPAATFAVARFTGRSTPKKTVRVEATLRASLQREGYAAVGPAVLALYDNPGTTLPFMRRNELHIEVRERSA